MRTRAPPPSLLSLLSLLLFLLLLLLLLLLILLLSIITVYTIITIITIIAIANALPRIASPWRERVVIALHYTIIKRTQILSLRAV